MSTSSKRMISLDIRKLKKLKSEQNELLTLLDETRDKFIKMLNCRSVNELKLQFLLERELIQDRFHNIGHEARNIYKHWRLLGVPCTKAGMFFRSL